MYHIANRLTGAVSFIILSPYLPKDGPYGSPVEQKHLTFIEHLDELRKRLVISLSAVFAGASVAFFYSEKLLAWLIAPVQADIGRVYFFSPAEGFAVRIKVSLLAGLLVAFPVVASQIWLFVAPALRAMEKKVILPLVFVTSLLFLGGVVFAFLGALPIALKYLMSMQTEFLRPMISISEYVSFLSTMLLAFGVAFNVPVFLVGLAGLGLLNSKTLGQYRKHAIVLIFIAAAVVTPSPDMASQLLLAVPLWVLFEVSVLGAKAVDFLRARRRSNCDDGLGSGA